MHAWSLDRPVRIPIEVHVAKYGPTIIVSGSCYPDFQASIWNNVNCATVSEFGLCNAPTHHSIISAQQIEDGSWVTLRHCPECGCTTTDVPNFNELAAEDLNRKPVDGTDFLEQLDELFN